jgi:hypothetical protein
MFFVLVFVSKTKKAFTTIVLTPSDNKGYFLHT